MIRRHRRHSLRHPKFNNERDNPTVMIDDHCQVVVPLAVA